MTKIRNDRAYLVVYTKFNLPNLIVFLINFAINFNKPRYLTLILSRGLSHYQPKPVPIASGTVLFNLLTLNPDPDDNREYRRQN